MREFFSAACEAAEAAGSLIQETWQRSKQIHYKSAIDLVTTVDRQAEERWPIFQAIDSRYGARKP